MVDTLEVVVQIENVIDQKLADIEPELVGREKDSGHWSEEYALCDDKDKSKDDLYNSQETVSSQSPTLDAVENENRIPTPPPLPPIPPLPSKVVLRTKRSSSLDGIVQLFAVEEVDSTEGYIVPSRLTSSATDIQIEELEDRTEECIVCYERNVVTEYDEWDYNFWTEIHHRISSHINLPCCNRLVCKDCLHAIITMTVGEGRIQISCPHPECGKPFAKEYVLQHIDNDTKLKYERFLVDIENDGKKKTCPNCCHITEHQLPRVKRLKEEDIKIKCTVCEHDWCYRCHAPWHKNISCRQFQKGNKEFKKWSNTRDLHGVANCQKCPLCRVYIQRSTGCNHMQCNRCDTDFCYYCGGRFWELGIIEHDSTLNVWGCPENYHKDEPVFRNFIRWGYLTAKISYLVAYPPVFIGACGLLAIGAGIALPIYGGFKLYSFAKYKKQVNRNKRRV